MRVLLVGNYLQDSQESMLRFSSIMERGLSGAGHQVQVCRPPVLAGRLWGSETGVGKWLGYVDKFAAFPAILRSAARNVDVVHICDHSNSFYVRHLRKQPHIVTCHDMLGIRGALDETPLNRPGWTGKQLQRLILRGLITAQHVACVSEATRADLLRVARMPERRVSKVYNGLNYPYSPMPEKDASARVRALGVDPAIRFILHVGGNSWYKNRLGVLRIFAALREHAGATHPKLVMAGKPWTPEMRSLVSKARLDSETLEVRDVSSEDLRALYSLAGIMLFPSLEEGFGWPIVEAQACGCIVVTSNRSPMREIGGPAAVYVDPENVNRAAATVRNVLEREDHRRDLSITNARRFTTASMIQGYLGLYEKVLHERA
jgi:glycosyltransferase involved in cell wall biosynthesis